MDNKTNQIPVSQPETEAADKSGEAAERGRAADRIDLISSIVLFCFGVFVFISGVYMSFVAVSSAEVWYYAPGMFPMFIGGVLCLLSIGLFIKKRKAGASFSRDEVRQAAGYFKSKAFLRLVAAVGFLAVYVFILLGRIPFFAATALYLAVNMIFFREKGFAVWKILVISLAVSAVLCLFFGKLAGIPLP